MSLLSFRSLSSMRARMTAGFVFILAPCLLIASTLVPMLASHVNELRSRQQMGWIVERVSERMDRPDWQAQLDALMAAKVPKISHVALLILDRDGTLVWRSRGPGPAWPSAAGSNWRREIRRLTTPPVEKPVGKGSGVSGPVKPEPPGPEKALGEWGNGLEKTLEQWPNSTGKAKVLSAAQAKMALGAAQAKMAGQGAVWPGKPWDDWRLVDGFVVGPKGRPRILVIFQSWWAVMHEQAALKLGLLLLSLFAVAAVAGGVWLLVGRTLSPIHRLAVQASAASVENLQVRLKAPSRDAEVVDLVDTLNGLLSRLAETAAVKGRFYAAASHELRTPLQALSGHLEVALSRERSAEEYETFLQEAHRQTGRLTSLVKDLLLLHQLDSAPPRPQEPVDLAEVCDGVLSHLVPLIDARELRLKANLSPGVVILAAPTHAEILIRNLVENAAKYAATGGEVTVSLTACDPETRLEVFNECPPVPGWNPEKLFEPFYRPDTARNTRTGGNGLGLAICRAIATANGWTVRLEQEARGVRAVAIFGERPAAVQSAGG
jgi:signal transduction histidine kinase